jgi:hypothetical protein
VLPQTTKALSKPMLRRLFLQIVVSKTISLYLSMVESRTWQILPKLARAAGCNH